MKKRERPTPEQADALAKIKAVVKKRARDTSAHDDYAQEAFVKWTEQGGDPRRHAQRVIDSHQSREKRQSAIRAKGQEEIARNAVSGYSRDKVRPDDKRDRFERTHEAIAAYCALQFEKEVGQKWPPFGIDGSLRALLKDAESVHQREMKAAAAIEQLRAAMKQLRRVAREDEEAEFPKDGRRRSLVDNAPTAGSAIRWAHRFSTHAWPAPLNEVFAARFEVGGSVASLAVETQRLAHYLVGRGLPRSAGSPRVVAAVWLLITPTERWPVVKQGQTPSAYLGGLARTHRAALLKAESASDPREERLLADLTEAVREAQEQQGRGKKKT